MRYAMFESIGKNSFQKVLGENKLTLYHELQEDVFFRENPHLLQFKKKKYVDPDILRAKMAPKTIFTNSLIKDSNGFEFGCKQQGLLPASNCFRFSISVQAFWLGKPSDLACDKNGF